MILVNWTGQQALILPSNLCRSAIPSPRPNALIVSRSTIVLLVNTGIFGLILITLFFCLDRFSLEAKSRKVSAQLRNTISTPANIIRYSGVHFEDSGSFP